MYPTGYQPLWNQPPPAVNTGAADHAIAGEAAGIIEDCADHKILFSGDGLGLRADAFDGALKGGGGEGVQLQGDIFPGCTSSRSSSGTLISAAMRSCATISAKLSPGLTMRSGFFLDFGSDNHSGDGRTQLGLGDALLFELDFGFVHVRADFGLARGGRIVAEFGIGEFAARLARGRLRLRRA